ncbi:hypothetical protein Anapl_14167 [Anas platyrhynchos]|uniref:Uncharacterized protein n=1 Tax=Anas platyrhynchos TaxID=8839 RepID=R0JUD5_ANAPL|nr:hypothetical protein Anapl_14167 [Anas platyrhynchos]
MVGTLALAGQTGPRTQHHTAAPTRRPFGSLRQGHPLVGEVLGKNHTSPEGRKRIHFGKRKNPVVRIPLKPSTFGGKTTSATKQPNTKRALIQVDLRILGTFLTALVLFAIEKDQGPGAFTAGEQARSHLPLQTTAQDAQGSLPRPREDQELLKEGAREGAAPARLAAASTGASGINVLLSTHELSNPNNRNLTAVCTQHARPESKIGHGMKVNNIEPWEDML